MDSWVWSTRAKNYDHVKLLNKHLYLQSAPMKYSLVPNKSSLKKQNKTNVQVPLFCSIALPQLQSYVPYKEQIYYLHLQSSPLSYDPNYVLNLISCSMTPPSAPVGSASPNHTVLTKDILDFISPWWSCLPGSLCLMLLFPDPSEFPSNASQFSWG